MAGALHSRVSLYRPLGQCQTIDLSCSPLLRDPRVLMELATGPRVLCVSTDSQLFACGIRRQLVGDPIATVRLDDAIPATSAVLSTAVGFFPFHCGRPSLISAIARSMQSSQVRCR